MMETVKWIIWKYAWALGNAVYGMLAFCQGKGDYSMRDTEDLLWGFFMLSAPIVLAFILGYFSAEWQILRKIKKKN